MEQPKPVAVGLADFFARRPIGVLSSAAQRQAATDTQTV